MLPDNFNEMTLEELKVLLERNKKYAEGYKSCQDGSYEACWHYEVVPVLKRIEELENAAKKI